MQLTTGKQNDWTTGFPNVSTVFTTKARDLNSVRLCVFPCALQKKKQRKHFISNRDCTYASLCIYINNIKVNLFSSSPPGSLSGLYSKALLQIRSISTRKSFAVMYWWASIFVMTVDRSIGCRITSR